MQKLESSHFFVDDVICLKKNKDKIGTVIKTTLDEDDDDDDEEIENVQLQPKHVRITLMNENEDYRDINENKLECIDRYLKLGDIARYPVELSKKQQTGTVIKVKVVTDLQKTLNEDSGVTIIKDIDTKKLKNFFDFEEGTCVILNNWFGIVREVFDEIYVRFSDNSICSLPASCVKIEDRCKESSRFYIERAYPGVKVVRTKNDTFKNAKWIKGHYKATYISGYVIMTKVVKVRVEWQYTNLKMDTASKANTPPPVSITDISSLTVLRSIHEQQAMSLGSLVMFSSIENAKEYDIETYDNKFNPCFKIVKTVSYVDIQWQDSTISRNIKSTDLVICYNIDEQDFWPTDYVYLKEDFNEKKNLYKIKVGVVKSVNATERICEVYWLDKVNSTKPMELKEQSIYEISSHPHYTQRLGERVIITSDIIPIENQCKGITNEEAKNDWVGEIIAINDSTNIGKVGVCCCPSRNIHWVYPYQIFTISEGQDEMDFSYDDDPNYISENELENYEVIEDNLEMDIDKVIYKDDENEDENNTSEWETDEDYEEEDDDEREDKINNLNVNEAKNLNINSKVDPKVVEKILKSLNNEKSKYNINNNDNHNENQNKNNEKKDENKTEVLTKEDVENAVKNVKEKDTTTTNNFIMLDEPPSNHHFINNDFGFSMRKDFWKTIIKEHHLLSTDLPSEGSIIVAAFSSRLDLLRALIFGPKDTIYEGAVFIFDIALPSDYPHSPPFVHYYSLTIGMGKLNPNLYEDGKVCLSLLGTWYSKDDSENWTPKSNILQVLLSIQGLVLGVQLPYFNEAGYDRLIKNSEENVTANYYNERAFYLSIHTINQTINLLTLSKESVLEIFRDNILDYYGNQNYLKYTLNKCQKIIENSENNENGSVYIRKEKLETVSKGCLILLKNEVKFLKEKLLNMNTLENK